ncbi:MAG: hypothetical protein SH808_12845 [Saprospiraceae bacterium]|nr:hypothetical protein [Saprospiraceae bacterium]
MKISIGATSFFLLMTSLTVIAQPGHMSKEVRGRIEAQRVAFITQQLRLTPEEAARFWPIYNEYRDALKVMREDFERPDLEKLTEEEAGVIIEQHLQQEQRKLELKRSLLTRLRTAINAKKVLMLQKAENEFNRELLRKVQEHRKP